MTLHPTRLVLAVSCTAVYITHQRLIDGITAQIIVASKDNNVHQIIQTAIECAPLLLVTGEALVDVRSKILPRRSCRFSN